MNDLPPIESIQSIDERAVRAHRAERIRHELRRRQREAVLVVDPINLRYATGTRNMQVWTMHNIVRYALAFAGGPTVLFDLATGRHLSAGLESVSEVRPSVPFDYMLVADNAKRMAARWAAQIRETLREHGCAADTLAVDRADTLMVRALDALGTRVVDGKSVLEHARAIKSAEEIRAFRLPDAYLANRYADLVHGCGLGVEYPFVLYPEDADDGMYDGRFEANVIVCVESYVGALDGPEGVKLEEPVLITESGPEVLTALPLDAADF